MQHYLKALKRKKSLPFSVGLVMLLVLTFYLSGCSGKNEVQDQPNKVDTVPNQAASSEEPPMIMARAAFFFLLTATPANGARTTRRSLQGIALSSRKRKTIPICSEHRVMSNIANQILCWQKPISLLLHRKTLSSPISMQPVRP